MISAEDLHAIVPHTPLATLAKFIDPLNQAMDEFEINNPARECAFLAQVAHESGGFRYVRELASGEAYEGRADLGNTETGDGRRFRGRGLIQITGRANYFECSRALLGSDTALLDQPERLEEPFLAARSACWFWATHGLNELSDTGQFKLITKRINGGYNGLKDRLALWDRAQAALA